MSPEAPAIHELRCRKEGCPARRRRPSTAIRRDAAFPGRFLRDILDAAPGCVAIWCPRCKVATEYRLGALSEQREEAEVD